MKHAKLIRSIEDLIETVEKAHAAFQQRHDGDVAAGLARAAPGDLVVDIFAGSNTAGMVAELEGRRWMSFEIDRGYLAASVFRFLPPGAPDAYLRAVHRRILHSLPTRLSPSHLASPGRKA